MEFSDHMIDLLKLAYEQNSLRTEYLIGKVLSEMRNEEKLCIDENDHYRRIETRYDFRDAPVGARGSLKKIQKNISLLESTLTSLRLK